MNMIPHGIEAPNIFHTNTLTENLADIQKKDRYDVVMANPPFGGKERQEVQQNFPIRTGETALAEASGRFPNVHLFVVFPCSQRRCNAHGASFCVTDTFASWQGGTVLILMKTY